MIGCSKSAHPRRALSWVVALAGVAAAVTPGAGQRPDGDPRAHERDERTTRLSLRTDRHTLRGLPIESRGAGALREMVREARRPGARRTVLELDGPLTPEREARLARAGVRIEAFVPPGALIADLSGANEDSAAGLEFVVGQSPFDDRMKLAPDLNRRGFQTPERRELARGGRSQVLITLFRGAGADGVLDAIEAMAGAKTVHRVDTLAGDTVIVATLDTRLIPALAARPEVQFIEDAPELTDRSTLATRWILQSNIANVTPLYDAGLRGEGQIIGVIDGATSALDMDHCSFKDNGPGGNTPGPGHRKVLAYNGALGKLSHGTHVSSIAAGDAGAEANTRGVAYNAKLVYAPRPSFTEMSVYNLFSLHHSQGARIHSNSWGDDSLGWYSSMCRGLDSFAYDHEDSLVCFSATNLQHLRTPENAKNVLAVGATQPAPGQVNHCFGGTGPTADGRRKPEIFAPGCSIDAALVNTLCGTTLLSGTSMACPAIAGAAALARQYYTEGFYPSGAPNAPDGFTPSGALIKATLLNATVDMIGVAGFPSNQEGWGRLLADNTLHFTGDASDLLIEDVRNADGLTTGESRSAGLTVLSGGAPLRVTLVWTDPPALAGADVALVNNLDLELVDPAGQVYRGNVFSAGASITGGAPDALNNVEQAAVAAPTPGEWSVRVRATGVNVGLQGYALVVSGDLESAPAPLSVVLSALPPALAPGCGPTVSVTVNEGDEALVPSSVRVYYRAEPGPFTELAVLQVGALSFEATLPAVLCDDTIEVYATAEGTLSGIAADPLDAPSAVLVSLVTGGAVTLDDDDFEAPDPGWTVGSPSDGATSGLWERAAPIGTSAQPAEDRTPGLGTNCWITGQHTPGQSAGFNDVDFGATTLNSPVFDLTATPNARVSYWRWYSTNTQALNEDPFFVSVSNDGGATWTEVERLAGTSFVQAFGGWFNHSFRPIDFLAVTDQMRVKFVATDAGGGHIVEGAIDDWQILDEPCAFPLCAGDANADLVVNFDDITDALSVWGAIGTPEPPITGDADRDGDVDFDDITAILSNWLESCCP